MMINDLEKIKNEGNLGSSEKEILENILKYSYAIYADTQKIRRYMFWQFMMGLLGFILVVAPIIVALIFLPPLFKGIFSQYQELLGTSGNAFNLLDQFKQFKP